MRLVAGRVPLLERHLARLASGGCGPRVLARVGERVAALLAETPLQADPVRLSVTVCADGSVEAGVTEAPSSLAVAGGLRYSVVEIEREPELPPSAAKPAARRYWDRAHRTATSRGAHQAVLASRDGWVIDGSTANVWIVSGKTLATPPAGPAVSGVARGLIFDAAPASGIRCEERAIAVDELDAAEEVFFSNAYGGVAPARGRGGSVYEAVSAAFEEAMGGRA